MLRPVMKLMQYLNLKKIHSDKLEDLHRSLHEYRCNCNISFSGLRTEDLKISAKDQARLKGIIHDRCSEITWEPEKPGTVHVYAANYSGHNGDAYDEESGDFEVSQLQICNTIYEKLYPIAVEKAKLDKKKAAAQALLDKERKAAEAVVNKLIGL